MEKAVKQYFFLHYPTRRHTNEDKVVYRTNAEDRKAIIERMGREEFYSCGMFKELYEPDVPLFFTFLYQIFIELYREDMSWQEVESYCRLRDIRLRQYEIDTLIKMRGWAYEQIKAMNWESEGN